MKRSTAVTETAQVLFSAETAIDSAFGQTAILASRLAQVRMEMGLSAVVGQRVFDAVTATLNELSQARAEIVRAHTELADVKIRIGCAPWPPAAATRKTPTSSRRPRGALWRRSPDRLFWSVTAGAIASILCGTLQTLPSARKRRLALLHRRPGELQRPRPGDDFRAVGGPDVGAAFGAFASGQLASGVLASNQARPAPGVPDR
jgi:hypothetical protein